MNTVNCGWIHDKFIKSRFYNCFVPCRNIFTRQNAPNDDRFSHNRIDCSYSFQLGLHFSDAPWDNSVSFSDRSILLRSATTIVGDDLICSRWTYSLASGLQKEPSHQVYSFSFRFDIIVFRCLSWCWCVKTEKDDGPWKIPRLKRVLELVYMLSRSILKKFVKN